MSRIVAVNSDNDSVYGFSYDEFKAKGKDILPESTYFNDVEFVRSLKLESELVIAGFDPDGLPLIIETNNDFDIDICEDFAVAGSGSYLAKAALIHRQHEELMPLNLALYNVYEAKRSAERVPTVGRHTQLVVLSEDEMRWLTQECWEKLRRLRKDYGPKTLPNEIELTDAIFQTEE